MRRPGSIRCKDVEPVERQHSHIPSSRGLSYWIVLVGEVVQMVIPTLTCYGSHGPKGTPSVEIVVRHLYKSLMQCRSVVWDKGFEAVRDMSGLCVDKHSGNTSPLSSSQGVNVASRCFYFYVECQTHIRSRIVPSTAGFDAEMTTFSISCAGGQSVESFGMQAVRSCSCCLGFDWWYFWRDDRRCFQYPVDSPLVNKSFSLFWHLKVVCFCKSLYLVISTCHTASKAG